MISQSFVDDKPRLRSFHDLMRRDRVYYYIPEYQRKLSWKKENIQRLFKDAAEGLNQLTYSDEISRASRFLGALVCFEEGSDHYSSVNPKNDDHPVNIRSIIDGQQRLTVLTLLCAEIHNQLRVQLDNKKIGKGWLRSQIERNIEELQRVLGEPTQREKDRFYPRTIRALDDEWGEQGQARYTSSLANFLDQYYAFLDSPGKKKLFKHKFEEKSFRDAMTCIRKKLKNIENSEDVDMPSLAELFNPDAKNNLAVMEELFGKKIELAYMEYRGKNEYILWETISSRSNKGIKITLSSIQDAKFEKK